MGAAELSQCAADQRAERRVGSKDGECTTASADWLPVWRRCDMCHRRTGVPPQHRQQCSVSPSAAYEQEACRGGATEASHGAPASEEVRDGSSRRTVLTHFSAFPARWGSPTANAYLRWQAPCSCCSKPWHGGGCGLRPKCSSLARRHLSAPVRACPSLQWLLHGARHGAPGVPHATGRIRSQRQGMPKAVPIKGVPLWCSCWGSSLTVCVMGYRLLHAPITASARSPGACQPVACE